MSRGLTVSDLTDAHRNWLVQVPNMDGPDLTVRLDAVRSEKRHGKRMVVITTNGIELRYGPRTRCALVRYATKRGELT